MPELENRSVYESKLSRSLAALGRDEMRELYRLLGEPPQAANVPQSFWDEHKAKIAAALSVVLYEVYTDSARKLTTVLPLGSPDWAKVATSAANFARSHSASVADDITQNTAEALAAILGMDWAARVLQERVAGIFGPFRAATIAVTEITRANTRAEQALARLVAAGAFSGIVGSLVPFHVTARDERVCGFCGPRDGKAITDGIYPPLHPRCRCGTEWKLVLR